MPNDYAIRLQNVSKIYKLHGSQRDQLVDVLGLQRIGIKPKTQPKEFVALNNINLDVPRGHRIGIVGRNGAGKTTLLKLLCGNFAPTHGTVEVNGQVQALMNVGLGFHPEYTGRENVEASLQYNGLARDEYEKAMEGIIEFCELGDFLDQPFKTYSLGMQARLMFAAATAIRPDILIVDEVLGAGDAYFVAKSKSRVEKLVSSGCTMLLVSHSMQQVLELCNEAIWLEKGSIKMRGEALVVVKAYEESLHGGLRSIDSSLGNIIDDDKNDTKFKNELKVLNFESHVSKRFDLKEDVVLQSPFFVPHQLSPVFHRYKKEDVIGFRHVARGGISRWESEIGIKIIGFAIQAENGFTNQLLVLRPCKLIIVMQAEIDKNFSCIYGVVINDAQGSVVSKIWSPPNNFELNRGENIIVELIMNPIQLGPGEYTIGISVHENVGIESINTACRYDLLGRSFTFTVEMEESLGAISANFMHSAEWKFQ